MRPAAVLLLLAAELAFGAPKIVGVYPLSGKAGTSVSLEIAGDQLSNATGVEFDCGDLEWRETTRAGARKLSGVVAIKADAAPGPHLLRIVSPDGTSTSALFNVTRMPTLAEVEPNDGAGQAQPILSLPVEIQGKLDGAKDIDRFSFRVAAGERWLFDFRALEHGSAVEARMILADAEGRQLEFNDDRGDYDENPLIDHTFEKAGAYTLTLDQYRGPRGFNFGKNNAYSLRISRSALVEAVTPAGAARGTQAQFRVEGRALDRVEKVYLTEARLAEYSRMTFPFTMPISFRADPAASGQVARLDGRIAARRAGRLDVELEIPAETRPGLWRLWLDGPDGLADSQAVEISSWPEFDELAAGVADWTRGGFVINGVLAKPGERDSFRIDGRAGVPLHFWTLAAQLGGRRLDTVLTLRDANGKRVAENDDVVAGQGSLIGNPDSSLYYTPAASGPLTLEVSDRLRRGGPGYVYRLKVNRETPGFQLFTTPENFTLARGGAGDVKVHLVRELDFAGEVSVWFEGLPPGVAAPEGKFRADQLFEPNADGADMIIPEITFHVQSPADLKAGRYAFRVMGCATAEKDRADRRVTEAHTAVMIGPLLDVWNFDRRPLPAITMTVVEPFDAAVSAATRTVNVERGGAATLELKLDKVPETAPIVVTDLPAGVSYRITERRAERAVIRLEAGTEAAAGTFDVSADAVAGTRRAAAPFGLIVQAPREGSRRGTTAEP